MGRVLKKVVTGYKCNLKSCCVKESITPVTVSRGWIREAPILAHLIDRGWAVVLTPRLRTYCPEHASKARSCICKTHPFETHLCALHSRPVAELIWDQNTVPGLVKNLGNVFPIEEKVSK